MMKHVFFTVTVLILISAVTINLDATTYAQDKIGVGVGTGRIQLDEALKPGMSYQLPPITVVNTGDITSDYSLTLTFHEGQAELRPELAWMQYDPEIFNLESGKAQPIALTLTLPIDTEPGEYFAYVEAYPITNGESGATAINVAAASRLYFSVEPANIFQGLYYRMFSLYKENTTLVHIAIGAILVFTFIQILRKFIDLDVSLKKKQATTNTDKSDDT